MTYYLLSLEILVYLISTIVGTTSSTLPPPRTAELNRRSDNYTEEEIVMITSSGFNRIGVPPWVNHSFNDPNAIHNFPMLHSILPTLLNATCSIELLGVLWLVNTVRRIQSRYLTETFASSSELSFITNYHHRFLNITTTCYHRSLYQAFWRPIQHFAIPIICPFYESSTCMTLDTLTTSNSEDTSPTSTLLTGNFHSVGYATFTRPITATIHLQVIQIAQQEKDTFETRLDHNDPDVFTDESASTPVGVCTALPYEARNNDTRMIQQRLLLDFIAYYSKLNMTVFVYDRYGRHYDPSFATLPYLRYFGYTIGQFVMDQDRLLDFPDEDKAMTLNHCRFEARIVEGISNIIVCDSDEFVYCRGFNTAQTQRKAIDQMFTTYVSMTHYDELIGYQVHTSTRSSSHEEYVECVLSAARDNRTLFPCYSTIERPSYRTHEKTWYMGMKCPITSFHMGCNPHGVGVCSSCSSYTNYFCNFLHLAMGSPGLKKMKHIYNSSSDDKVTELQTIMLS